MKSIEEVLEEANRAYSNNLKDNLGMGELYRSSFIRYWLEYEYKRLHTAYVELEKQLSCTK